MSLQIHLQSRHDLYSTVPLTQDVQNFRLVVLEPGFWTEPVSCILVEMPLAQSPPYKALSYAWYNGEYSGLVPIFCNQAFIKVSRNLFSALRRLRHPTETVHLWVDAICINQKDDRERTHQVKLMRDIYERSYEVAIWLGEAGEQDDLGDDIVSTTLPLCLDWAGNERDQQFWDQFLARETELDRDTRDIFGAFCVLWLLAMDVEASLIKPLRHTGRDNQQTNTILNGLQAIMEQTWWTRIWVVQETVVATRARVYYDKISAPWSMLTRAADTYNKGLLMTDADSVYPYLRPLSRFSHMIYNIEATRQAWQSQTEPLELLQILRQFRTREATDPKDKVYALLGIVQDWGGPRILLPNYAEPIANIYRQTTTTLIQNTQSLDVLAGFHGPLDATFPKSSARRPSWVTDWSSASHVNDKFRLDTLHLYNTSMEDITTTRPVRVHAETLLEIHGFLFDRVVHVSPKRIIQQEDRFEVLHRDINVSRAVVLAWDSLLHDTEGGRLTYPGGCTISDAFWRTLCADVEYTRDTDRGSPHRAHESIASAYHGWLNSKSDKRRRNTSIIDGYWQESYVSTRRSTKEGIKAEKKNAFHHAVNRAAGGRSFFITHKGYIGLGPENMAPGDEVFVVSGSRVPFILRSAHQSMQCVLSLVETLAEALGRSMNNTEGEAAETLRHESDLLLCLTEHTGLYKLVGDAYVHGIMDGEAVDAVGSGSFQPIYLW